MYLHIGDNQSVPYQDIVAILNLDVIEGNSVTQEILNWESWSKNSKGKASSKKAKSCIITNNNYYFSTISALTLLERTKNQSFL